MADIFILVLIYTISKLLATMQLFSKSHSFLYFICIFFLSSCNTPPLPMDLAQNLMIPKAANLEATGSSFSISPSTSIYLLGDNEELAKVAERMAEYLRPSTGFPLEIISSKTWPGPGNILLNLDAKDKELGKEGYKMDITENLLVISANDAQGIFYGVQSLRQLLPSKIELKSKQSGPWSIGTGTIKDYPRFAYRGAMLDVARHFYEMDEVKRFIDFMAMYKLNNLHLHLSDDQGWRIEIKSWPRLAEYGGSTEVGGGEGGYYTQEQYKEIIAYAADRFITVIPEIDMPGHTNAALASYPDELYCTGREPSLYTGIEVGFSTLCTSRERVYEFVDDVIGELAAITPGPYIHIGGDETLATKLEDYIPFMNRVKGIVEMHVKKLKGWDEIAQSRLKKNTVAQFWKFIENAQAAVDQGAKVLVSPASNIYLDHQYDSTSKYGLHWAGYIEIDKSYRWDPVEILGGIDSKHILGVESPLFSETLETMKEAEYMIFPRLPGHAEIGWSPLEGKSWEEYRIRLGKQKNRFEALNIDYYPSKQIPWKDE
ncbi:MAG: beta-N-acetylhexosaminidase [Bacteroidota bacterium]